MDGIVGMIKLVLAVAETREWTACDGRSLSCADYPELFAVIGHRFGGTGDNFALPVMPPQNGAHFMIKARPGAADATYRGTVAQVVVWPGEGVPAGWLPCDGRLIEGRDYPLLQKAARAGGQLAERFHLPSMPSQGGVAYLICVDGIDPTATATAGGDDDDY